MSVQLIGALIGIAWAAEGNSRILGADVHNAVLTGMRTVFSETEQSQKKIIACIENLRSEKRKLVPQCFECAEPCGRNNDFDISETTESETNLSCAKFTLLTELLSLEPLLRHHQNGMLFERAMDFIYKGFFYMGYDCDTKSVWTMLNEIKEVRKNLTETFSQTADE